MLRPGRVTTTIAVVSPPLTQVSPGRYRLYIPNAGGGTVAVVNGNRSTATSSRQEPQRASPTIWSGVSKPTRGNICGLASIVIITGRGGNEMGSKKRIVIAGGVLIAAAMAIPSLGGGSGASPAASATTGRPAGFVSVGPTSTQPTYATMVPSTTSQTPTTTVTTNQAVTTTTSKAVTTTSTQPATTTKTSTTSKPATTTTTESSSAYFKNCAEAKAAGAAPLHRGDPGYRSALDRDGDGVACEN